MSFFLNKKEYEKLIKEDIEALIRTMPNCLARDHIIDILNDSVNYYYPSTSEND